jgi:hypothetical protein
MFFFLRCGCRCSESQRAQQDAQHQSGLQHSYARHKFKVPFVDFPVGSESSPEPHTLPFFSPLLMHHKIEQRRLLFFKREDGVT